MHSMPVPARPAARLGFSYEGTFFQHLVVKGQIVTPPGSRFWTATGRQFESNFETYLAADNFDADGRQKISLGDLNRAVQ